MPSRDPHHNGHHEPSRSWPFHQNRRTGVRCLVWARSAGLLRGCCANCSGRLAPPRGRGARSPEPAPRAGRKCAACRAGDAADHALQLGVYQQVGEPEAVGGDAAAVENSAELLRVRRFAATRSPRRTTPAASRTRLWEARPAPPRAPCARRWWPAAVRGRGGGALRPVEAREPASWSTSAPARTARAATQQAYTGSATWVSAAERCSSTEITRSTSPERASRSTSVG
jgi:hypothetical protein